MLVNTVVSDITNIEYGNETNYDDEDQESLIECLPECEHFAYPLQVALGTVSDRIPLTGIAF